MSAFKFSVPASIWTEEWSA